MRWIETTAVAATAFVLLVSTGASAQTVSTVYGQAQQLGEGFAQLYVDLDATGAPRTMGVSFTHSALEGLPDKPNNFSRCFDKMATAKSMPPASATAISSSNFRYRWSLLRMDPRRSNG